MEIMKEKIKKFLDNGRDAIVIIFILEILIMYGLLV